MPLKIRDENRASERGATVPLSQEGAGAVLFEQGDTRIVASNITSDPESGLGKWSDDAIARAMASVVVFIRSLPAVRNQLPSARIPFLFGRIIQAAPQPVTDAVPEPDTSTLAKRGAYLTIIGTCKDCHTPRNAKFQPAPGMEMAGGTPMAERLSTTTRRGSSRPSIPVMWAHACSTQSCPSGAFAT
jgi:hypothetical protein